MDKVLVQFRQVAGTEAMLGMSGPRTVIADRPQGKAGGMGLGFNGAELLALAIGGCFSNDLRYVAHEMDVELKDVEVDVTLRLGGTPLLATGAELTVHCTTADGDVATDVIAAAKARSMVSLALSQPVPISFVTGT